MGSNCQGQVIGFNARTIITHANQACAALLDIDFDASRPRIQAVFDQFLDHRRRSFDHLAGSDLIDQFGGQGTDARHRNAVGSRLCIIADRTLCPIRPRR